MLKTCSLQKFENDVDFDCDDDDDDDDVGNCVLLPSHETSLS